MGAWYSRELSHPSLYALILPRPGDPQYVPHFSSDRLEDAARLRAVYVEQLLEIVRDKPNLWWEEQPVKDSSTVNF
ncbi:hypothetical protein LC605_20775 [Nostoc sp. CHAB 5836]|uniref:hypothetical protein n=1 Tax=Nostoc sp. CHAB 5836 TaxID=2780404 RepID=UPI001E61C61D|nr:hypothetical protein [Nostoc sp. CHAB 5836]MCC5617476.1 hypothetical protein [Nostoc sp. CHAB 5836]